MATDNERNRRITKRQKTQRGNRSSRINTNRSISTQQPEVSSITQIMEMRPIEPARFYRKNRILSIECSLCGGNVPAQQGPILCYSCSTEHGCISNWVQLHITELQLINDHRRLDFDDRVDACRIHRKTIEDRLTLLREKEENRLAKQAAEEAAKTDGPSNVEWMGKLFKKMEIKHRDDIDMKE